MFLWCKWITFEVCIKGDAATKIKNIVIREIPDFRLTTDWN